MPLLAPRLHPLPILALLLLLGACYGYFTAFGVGADDYVDDAGLMQFTLNAHDHFVYVDNVDEILHEAWQAGIVMSGVSAGSICWHQGGSTDSYGLELRGFTEGLGWLPYSNGVHYDAEEQRRPKMHELIGDGTLGDGYATDDGAGLVYRGTALDEVVADREGPLGYELKRAADGSVVETALPTRILPIG